MSTLTHAGGRVSRPAAVGLTGAIRRTNQTIAPQARVADCIAVLWCAPEPRDNGSMIGVSRHPTFNSYSASGGGFEANKTLQKQRLKAAHYANYSSA